MGFESTQESNMLPGASWRKRMVKLNFKNEAIFLLLKITMAAPEYAQ